MVMDLQSIGLPHSEIPGSGVICTSPGLIAAYHVLLRLREPRHPPVALSYFFLAVRTRNSSAAKDGGFGTCSIQLRVVFNLAIKFWILICPSPCSGRRLYLLHYLKLFSICQRSSILANRWGCLQLRTALFHLASLDPESPGTDKQASIGRACSALSS